MNPLLVLWRWPFGCMKRFPKKGQAPKTLGFVLICMYLNIQLHFPSGSVLIRPFGSITSRIAIFSCMNFVNILIHRLLNLNVPQGPLSLILVRIHGCSFLPGDGNRSDSMDRGSGKSRSTRRILGNCLGIYTKKYTLNCGFCHWIPNLS